MERVLLFGKERVGFKKMSKYLVFQSLRVLKMNYVVVVMEIDY